MSASPSPPQVYQDPSLQAARKEAAPLWQTMVRALKAGGGAGSGALGNPLAELTRAASSTRPNPLIAAAASSGGGAGGGSSDGVARSLSAEPVVEEAQPQEAEPGGASSPPPPPPLSFPVEPTPERGGSSSSRPVSAPSSPFSDGQTAAAAAQPPQAIAVTVTVDSDASKTADAAGARPQPGVTTPFKRGGSKPAASATTRRKTKEVPNLERKSLEGKRTSCAQGSGLTHALRSLKTLLALVS